MKQILAEVDLNTVMLLSIAMFNCVTALISLRNHRAIKRVEEDVKVVERATNSMKDALIISTDKASRAEGHAQGLQQGRDESANGKKP